MRKILSCKHLWHFMTFSHFLWNFMTKFQKLNFIWHFIILWQSGGPALFSCHHWLRYSLSWITDFLFHSLGPCSDGLHFVLTNKNREFQPFNTRFVHFNETKMQNYAVTMSNFHHERLSRKISKWKNRYFQLDLTFGIYNCRVTIQYILPIISSTDTWLHYHAYCSVRLF